MFKGYLFAGEVLLNESGMQNHPLTPMTDANLGRVLQAQTRRKLGLIDHVAVAHGAEAIRERIAQVLPKASTSRSSMRTFSVDSIIATTNWRHIRMLNDGFAPLDRVT